MSRAVARLASTVWALAAIGAGVAVAAPPDPPALGKALIAAGADAGALEPLLTEAARALPPGASPWGAGLVVEGTRAEGDRAVLTAKAGGRAVLLLAVRGADGWRVDEVTGDLDRALAFLGGADRMPPPDAELRGFGERLARAIETDNRPALVAATSPAARVGEQRSEAGLFWQFVHKKMGLVVTGARSVAHRGVIDGDVTRDGRLVDRVQLITTRVGERWQVDDITEDRARVMAWLAGEVPARLDLDGLGSTPAARALADRVRAALAARDAEATIALLGDRIDATPGMGQPRLRGWLRETLPRITAVGAPTVRVSKRAGRALVELTIAERVDGERVERAHTLYLVQRDGEWRWIDLGFVPRRAWVFGLGR